MEGQDICPYYIGILKGQHRPIMHLTKCLFYTLLSQGVQKNALSLEARELLPDSIVGCGNIQFHHPTLNAG